ncbi:MAG: hypothetical protein ACMUIP_06130 [bacterium]
MRHNTMYAKIFTKIIVIVFISFLCISSEIMAKGYPRFPRGIRPLGMGGAYTAVADGQDALFYNPAGLSVMNETKKKEPRFLVGLFNPMFAVSDRCIDLLNDSLDADMNDSTQITDIFRDYIGDHQHLRFSFIPHVGYTVSRFGMMVGVLGQETVDVGIHNPVWPEIDLDFVQDTGILIGFGYRSEMIEHLRVGAAFKYIYRESLQGTYTPTDIASNAFENSIENDKYEGSGRSVDLGLMYRLPFSQPNFIAEFGAILQNYPEMDMGDAVDAETQINMGLAFKTKISAIKITGTLDYHDVTYAIDYDNDLPKRLHMGIEFGFLQSIFLRTGLNQGYITAGLALDKRVVKFDLVTYGEEVGAYAGQKEDRRFVLKITLGW